MPQILWTESRLYFSTSVFSASERSDTGLVVLCETSRIDLCGELTYEQRDPSPAMMTASSSG